MNIFYTLNPFGKIQVIPEKIIMLDKFEEIDEIPAKESVYVLGNRLGLFPRYSSKKKYVVILPGYDKVYIGPYYIRVDAGVSYYELIDRLFDSNVYIPLSYPPNPFETLAGLFMQKLLNPSHASSLEEMLYKLTYYDFNERALISIRKNFYEVIEKGGVAIIRFYFKKYLLPSRERISLFRMKCSSVPTFLLKSSLSKYDLSYIRGQDGHYVLSLVPNKIYLKDLENLLRKLGCKKISSKHSRYLSLLPYLYHMKNSFNISLCMYSGITNTTVYYNTLSRLSIELGECKNGDCIARTWVNKGEVESVWRI